MLPLLCLWACSTPSPEPILDRPVVLGALDPAQVEEAIAGHREAIDACWQQQQQQQAAHGGKTGKVLVRFPVNAQGEKALVTYTFASPRA